MTLVAPTTSPFRRQWAALVTDNLRQINIDARLVYVSFGTMAALAFSCTNNCGKTYDQGGFDAVFVGFGGGPDVFDWTGNVLYESSASNDYSPRGGNFFFYHNDTYNQLNAQYFNEFNASARVAIAQQMVRIVAQDRPDMPLFYPVDIFGVSNHINQWNGKAVETESTVTRDFQHWGVSQGGSINVAEQGGISSVDQWVTSASNTRFDGYLYNPTVSTLEELDARTLQFSKALARSITYSSDHLTWTVTFRPHTFQDGVNVTADDYIFAMMGQTINDVGSVNAGTLQSLLGNYGGSRCNCSGIKFTYLNGTSDFVWNGNYSRQFSNRFTTTSTWRSLNDTAFQFTMSNWYTFTDPVLTSFAAQPMHIFETMPFSQWSSSPFATLHGTPYVYTYNHPGQSNHGGNGSATAYGPIGDGPYYYHGYDSSNGVGTLVKWKGYWNASGLEHIGLFNASTLRVFNIPTRDAAIAAFQAGQVNFLDDNYAFYYPDFANLGPITGT
jgi:ABC-type oligopeptide transport system substrate-binding subunit